MATAPHCTTRSAYLANKILQGLFGSPVESLCEISLTDIWFAHERPKYLAWYGFSLSVTGKLAPMLSGFINTGQGWQWTLYWCAIWNAIAFVYCFFLMEETNYDRVHTPSPRNPANPHGESASSTHSVDPSDPPEKKALDIHSAPVDVEIGGQTTYKQKTYWQKLGFKDKKRPNRMLDIVIAPFKGFTYPVVVWAGMMYGANNLVWSGVQNATTGTVYTTMYGFSTTGVALAYFGGLVGSVIGGYFCGKAGRVLTVRLARRNGGISEPEHTLYMFIASMILVPFSMLLYGLGVTYHIHYMGLIISQAALAVSNALAVAASLGYAISSYHALSGDMITTCILIRNTLSFAINYGITPWLQAMGYRNTFITVACLGFFWNATLFLMVAFGRKLREMSAPRYWKEVEKARAKGLSH